MTVVLSGCGQAAFVPYAPTVDLVPALAEPSSVHLGSPELPIYAACDVDELRRSRDSGPDSSEWRAVTQILPAPDSRSRIVWFATERFGSDGDFDDRRTEVGTWFSEPCVDEDGTTWLEPTTIDGLPDGAIAANWSVRDADAVSAVLFEPDRRLMMIVVWYERPAAVPEGVFVDVVNTAWSTFVEDNTQ